MNNTLTTSYSNIPKKESVETKILTQICLSAISETNNSSINTFNDGINWKKIIELAEMNSVCQLLYIGLTNRKLDYYVPDREYQKLKAYTISKTANNLDQSKEFLEINNDLRNLGIRVVPFKGIVLAMDGYNNIGARNFSDIDILIKREDVDAVSSYLEEKQYAPRFLVNKSWRSHIFKNYCDYTFDFDVNGQRKYHVEPHWALNARKNQSEFSLVELEAFITDSQLFNQKIEKFNTEGLYISTCLHHIAKEQYFRLKHVFDLIAIIKNSKKEIDWKMIMNFGNKFDITNILLVGLGLAKNYCDIDLPLFINKKLRSPKIKSLVSRKIENLIHDIQFGFKKTSYWRKMKNQIQLRTKLSIKLKIIYYHFLFILQPGMMGLKNNEYSLFSLIFLYITKPFRLMKKVIAKPDQ